MTKQELDLIKSIVKNATKQCFETLSDERKAWSDVKPILNLTGEFVFLMDKLDRVNPTIVKDNLTFYGNFENKETKEEFYKNL